jgi:crotonobetaine/carnitine-CoA ligase
MTAAISPVWRNPDAVSIPQVLREASAKWADRPFVDVDGDVFSFSELERAANRLSHGLTAIGVRRGETVSCMLDASLDFVTLWFAVVQIGAVLAPLNTAFRGEFLRHQITDSAAKLVICETHYAERIVAIEAQLPAVARLIHRGPAPALHTRLELLSFDTLPGGDGSPPTIGVGPGDLACLIYTSGTTGPSKGCMLCHNAPIQNGVPALRAQGLSDAEALWMSLPLFHMAALSLLLGCLRLGARVIIASRFSVSGFWADIERSRATAVIGLSTMLPLLADAPETVEERRCRGQLRFVFGSPFRSDVQRRWKERFGVQHTASLGYGMTEATPLAMHPGHDVAVPPDAAGRLNPLYDVRIVDEDGNEVSAGVAGEIVVRPRVPHIMFDGYWRRPEATVEVFRGLWFHCGDIGKIDEQGYLYFVDRKKDYLRSRGENISSYELETIFREHPAIAEAAVHAVPSELSEDEVKATLQLREGLSASEIEICLWAIERLPYFAVPRYIEFRSELPRNAVGRVLKFELRAQGVTAQTWDREKANIKVSSKDARKHR